MTEKLRSHLRSEKGFTLIELLVVIAIIAILVVIVIVAINPVQRINDANDRQASSNVRSTGTLLSTCVTQELAAGNAYEPCGAAGAPLSTYGNPANGVTLGAGAVAGDNDVCAAQQGSAANYYVYRHSTGASIETAGTLPAVGTWCP